MTKAELIERIARSRDLPPDVTKKCIATILDIAFEEVADYFVRARVTRTSSPRLTYPGFGTFTKKKRSARRGVNPRTLEPMEIDAACTIDFRPGTELKGALNSSKRLRSDRGEKPAPRLPRGDGAPAVDAAPRRNRVDGAVSPSGRRLVTREEGEFHVGPADDLALPLAPLQRVGRKGRRDLGNTG